MKDKDIKKEPAVLINERIRAEKMQLITDTGENIGVVSRGQALRMAEDAGFDLVLVTESGKDGLPIAKIMNFGKTLYEKKKNKAEAKKHQKIIQIKEIKLRPKIGEHDYQTKMKQAIQFLHDGKRVKITLWFKGRENATKEERGKELFERIEASFIQNEIMESLAQEKDAKAGQLWSRVYYVKNLK
ncbi:MAG: translation initiation factor IF-3 [Candidatus Dependentiae bacterium]|nr:translation initiation factor IF-3 [Candidatus Dependentiae bacterium]